MTPQPPCAIGNVTVTLTPHYLPGVGARLFFTTSRPLEHLSAEDARRLAEYFKIAACHAETLERHAQRRREKAA